MVLGFHRVVFQTCCLGALYRVWISRYLGVGNQQVVLFHFLRMHALSVLFRTAAGSVVPIYMDARRTHEYTGVSNGF